MGRISPDPRRIARLAEQTALFNAQRWFARERAWINEQHLQLCRVAAPTFFEQQRAEWFRNQLASLGWYAKLDRAGNVLASFRDSAEHPGNLVVSAHLDTVFAPSRPEEIHFGPDGRLFGPGVSDNGSGLAALLALGRVLAETPDLHELARAVLLGGKRWRGGRGQSQRNEISLPSIPAALHRESISRSGWTLHGSHHGAGAREPAGLRSALPAPAGTVGTTTGCRIRFTRSVRR